ncbi:MAG TPA: hypothetical protein VGI21_23195 [Streptosporangiaceae bacterium]
MLVPPMACGCCRTTKRAHTPPGGPQGASSSSGGSPSGPLPAAGRPRIRSNSGNSPARASVSQARQPAEFSP